MIFLRRLLAEPLVQFLIIGAVVFGAWSWLDRSPQEAGGQVIEVGPGRIAQLHETFARAWQRPPTPQELTGLIESFVKEEIFYRESIRMGLDRDDTVVRRRMQQKMDFLMEPGQAELNATDVELQDHLEENAATFRIPMRIAFRQIYFDTGKRGDAARDDAAVILAALENGGSGEIPAGAGDPTLLPPAVPLMRIDQIATDFGTDFAKSLGTAATGRWTGPVTSAFGQHLFFIEERTEARDPRLDEVRDIVLREWQSAKRRVLAEQRYQALRANYKVNLILPGQETTPAAGLGN